MVPAMNEDAAGPILIAYDGSPDAQAAIRSAADLFAGRSVVVLTVWQSVAAVARGARAVLPAAVVSEALAALDEAARSDAEKTAAEGVALAREAGLDASAAEATAPVNVWSTVLDEASRLDAAAVVVGTRGLSGVKAAMLGSVSRAISTHSDRPVLVVRGPAS
jgi:nucleotide-binding universal stress UspA family protein